MFEIQVQSGTAIALFKQLAAKISDTRPVMVEISGVLLDSVEENFDVEGRPSWAKLSPQRIYNRTKKGTWPGKILTEFGQLAASVSPRATVDTAVVGTNVAYAGKMQRDRPFLVAQPEDIAEAELRLLRHLLR